jgi:hypothetical protein
MHGRGSSSPLGGRNELGEAGLWQGPIVGPPCVRPNLVRIVLRTWLGYDLFTVTSKGKGDAHLITPSGFGFLECSA